jgi:hypothetical protein
MDSEIAVSVHHHITSNHKPQRKQVLAGQRRLQKDLWIDRSYRLNRIDFTFACNSV